MREHTEYKPERLVRPRVPSRGKFLFALAPLHSITSYNHKKNIIRSIFSAFGQAANSYVGVQERFLIEHVLFGVRKRSEKTFVFGTCM